MIEFVRMPGSGVAAGVGVMKYRASQHRGTDSRAQGE